MRHPGLSPDAVHDLVHAFYGRVQSDGVLGPVFDVHIGHEPASWQVHLDTMVRFWRTILLQEPLYSGNPLAVHRAIPELQPAHFSRWLQVFAETAHSVLQPGPAGIVIERSQRMGRHLTGQIFGQS